MDGIPIITKQNDGSNPDTEDMKAMTIDEVFQTIGGFGKYQLFLVGLCGYFAFTCGSFGMMIVTFITAEPDWVCVKGYNNTICNFTEPITLTSDNYEARCDMPREAWAFVDDFTSAVTEYDLVCENSLLLSIAQSCFWVGTLIGFIFSGYLADRFGRRIVLYSSCLLVAAATWLMVFPREFILFIVCRIIIGVGVGSNNISYVLLPELTTMKYRARTVVATFYIWVFGFLVLALLAFLIRDWRMLLLATAAISTPTLVTWWLIPESPRWLLLHCREKEAWEWLEKVAKVNRKSCPKGKLQNPKDPGVHGRFNDLFYVWETRKRTILSWDLWFTTALVYYGISYGSVDLGGNRYLSFALASVVELPANFTAILTANRFGRKKTVLIPLVVAFLISVISVSIPSDRDNAGYNGGRIIVAVVAKYFITMAYSTVFVWSGELFPTCIRGMGVCTSFAASAVGSIVASYIIWLVRVHSFLPYGIMGLICLQAAILGKFLPETKGKATLETMDDMVNCKMIQSVNTDDFEAKKIVLSDTDQV